MLSPSEFSVGCIGDATTSLTLVLSRGQYEYPVLVTQAPGTAYAIILAGQYQFGGFECPNNDSWNGILIPNVSIEVDEESVFDVGYLQAPLGTLVRRGTQLDIITRADGTFPRLTKTPLIVDLPPCHENMAAGFNKWRIFLGEGLTKRELMRIDISDKLAN